jgi:hypothetical protein
MRVDDRGRTVFELKTLSRDAVAKALEKAMRYRLLNEPGESESICLDILRIDPENQEALVTLLLARTDQFDRSGATVSEARDVLPRLHGEYERAYYAGIIYERRARAQIEHGGPGVRTAAYGWLREAMNSYEKAETLRPTGNDDAILRWNTCARLIMRHPEIVPGPEERWEPPLE